MPTSSADGSLTSESRVSKLPLNTSEETPTAAFGPTARGTLSAAIQGQNLSVCCA